MSLQIIEWDIFLKEPVTPGECAVTIGVFDGVHPGHLKLIRAIVSRGPNPTVVTFRENPKKFFSESYEGDLFSLKQRLAVFEREGVSRVILIDFSEEFSKLKGGEFLRFLAERKMVFLAIGSNFRCGYKQEADADFISETGKRRGILTEVISQITAPEGFVSSSRIRAAIISGDLKRAAALSGRNIELDLSDIKPEPDGRKLFIYDFGPVRRIVPAAGPYPVLLHPGGTRAEVLVENGKICLPGEAEGLEFLVD
jgi:riboflavin kinase/FMN adenylyltransferase